MFWLQLFLVLNTKKQVLCKISQRHNPIANDNRKLSFITTSPTRFVQFVYYAQMILNLYINAMNAFCNHLQERGWQDLLLFTDIIYLHMSTVIVPLSSIVFDDNPVRIHINSGSQFSPRILFLYRILAPQGQSIQFWHNIRKNNEYRKLLIGLFKHLFRKDWQFSSLKVNGRSRVSTTGICFVGIEKESGISGQTSCVDNFPSLA